jgi:hypothetical protein
MEKFRGIIFFYFLNCRTIFHPPVGCRFTCWLQSRVQCWHSALLLWTEQGRIARVEWSNAPMYMFEINEYPLAFIWDFLKIRRKKTEHII